MVKKEGPCNHCGVTTTPLWRNGPPEKPVLCNACGSRWRTRGTLLHYIPAHRREDTDAERKQPKKRPSRRIPKNEPCADQNFWKMGDAADTSNPSGSGSALSYSESCALYGSVDGTEMAGSVQSLVPPRKRSCVGHRKLSLVQALAENLKSVMHEEKPYCLSARSIEEDLLYHRETPVGSFETGYGSMLLRHPNQRILENVDSSLVLVALENNYNREVGGGENVGAFRGLSKSSMMRPLKRPHESQPQCFTVEEVRGGGIMRIASSRPRVAMAACQLRRSSFLRKPGNPSGAGINLPMVAPPDKNCDQDSLLLEVPRNARQPEAELLCCPPPSELSSVTLPAISPPN